MFALIANLWNDFINKCFREVSPSVKGIIIGVSLLLAFFCFAKCINTGGSHNSHPIKYGILILGLLFLAVAILYTVL